MWNLRKWWEMLLGFRVVPVRRAVHSCQSPACEGMAVPLHDEEEGNGAEELKLVLREVRGEPSSAYRTWWSRRGTVSRVAMGWRRRVKRERVSGGGMVVRKGMFGWRLEMPSEIADEQGGRPEGEGVC